MEGGRTPKVPFLNWGGFRLNKNGKTMGIQKGAPGNMGKNGKTAKDPKGRFLLVGLMLLDVA